MHFDDRLATVLRQPVRGREIARVQYVQLLDLLGKTAANTDSARLDPAYARLSALSAELSGDVRAQLLRASGLKLRSPALVAYLAEDDATVASAAIAAADLAEREWLDLIPALQVGARGILRHRRDLGPLVEARLDRLGVADRGLPPAAKMASSAPPAAPQAKNATPADPIPSGTAQSGIGDLVRRIEAFRKTQPALAPEPETHAPRLPLGDSDHAPPQPVHRFDFVTDTTGRIVRADPEAAPMLVGTAIGALACRRVEGFSPQPGEALRLRQPIEGQIVTIDGAPSVAGHWRIDAAPVFDAASGRYIGHAGRARRLAVESLAVARAGELSDRMRQVLHELRNPAGAIQMASEFIQQQVGGSVAHEYRALAATIASDTATVLAGLEEVERLVKCDAGVSGLEEGEADLAAIVATSAALLDRHMAQRESGYALEMADAPLAVAIARSDLERLVWRLLAAVAGAAGPIERIALRLSAHGRVARVELALPASLHALTDEELFAAQAKERNGVLAAGMFGLGFTLRLAAAEARSAGGLLRREGERLMLELPLAGESSANIRGI